MSAWELGTWAAIGCLGLGSVAVFAWFVRDAAALFRRRTRRDG